MPQATIDQINTMLNEVKNILDEYSKYILAVDNKRFDEKENKKSFLEYAYELAEQNGELLPHYMTLERFITDIEYFVDFRDLLNLNNRIQEKLWDMTIKSADIMRKDAMPA